MQLRFGISSCQTFHYLPLSYATPEQKDKKKNRNRNSNQPQQDITGRADFPDFFPQVQVVLPPEPESDEVQPVSVSEYVLSLGQAGKARARLICSRPVLPNPTGGATVAHEFLASGNRATRTTYL